MDELLVRCEPTDEVTDLGGLRQRVERALRQETGLAMAVQVLERGAVPRSEGKAVRVIDRRGGSSPAAGGRGA